MGKTNLGRVAFAPHGTYSNETAYKRLDVVEHEGNSFLFLKDSTGITPTGDGEVTMLLAKKGKDFIYDDFTPEQLVALKGADGKDGLKGDKGDPGKGLSILGYYGTLDLLKAAVTTPEPGDAYGIGTAAPYDIYVFDSVTSDWLNNGKLSGGGGTSSEANIVIVPMDVIETLGNESTSEQIINAFGGKPAFDAIVEKVRVGNAVAITASSSGDSACSAPCFITVNNYVDYSNLDMQLIVAIAGDTLILGVTVENSVFSVQKAALSALQSTDLVSDPSVGGTDKPASAEAVKIVNDKIAGGSVDVVRMPLEVSYLSNNSTSEEIISAFGGISKMEDIWKRLMNCMSTAIISSPIYINPSFPMGMFQVYVTKFHVVSFYGTTPIKLEFAFDHESETYYHFWIEGKTQVGWENNYFSCTVRP